MLCLQLIFQDYVDMVYKKIFLLEQGFHRKALIICSLFIALLFTELIVFTLFKYNGLYVLNGPLFLILADSLRNKTNKRLVSWSIALCSIFLVASFTFLGEDYLYVILLCCASLICCSMVFFRSGVYKHIVTDFRYWLKYIAFFQILIAFFSLLFLVNVFQGDKVKINTFFYGIGLTAFSLFYVLMLQLTLFRFFKGNSYWITLDNLKDVHKDKIGKLEEYFSTNKDFLDPDFTIDELAKSLNIEKKELSFLLNQVLESNFYTLLAEKRIAVAERLIMNYSNVYTIEYIMLQAGFRSKSSFNRYFKKYTNYTPSEFRDRISLKKA